MKQSPKPADEFGRSEESIQAANAVARQRQLVVDTIRSHVVTDRPYSDEIPPSYFRQVVADQLDVISSHPLGQDQDADRRMGAIIGRLRRVREELGMDFIGSSKKSSYEDQAANSNTANRA